jgi:LuxR family transcriptional regulator, quorum-sensing system regulator BjaR1
MFSGDHYSKRTLDFVERLQKLTRYGDICQLIMQEMQWYGFQCVTSFSVPGTGQTLKDCLWMNNRPQDYIDHYSAHNYILRDPIVTEFRRTVRPYSWNDVRKVRQLDKSEKKIIDEAREWGAHDGFMVPIVTRTGSMAGFCPCGPAPDLSPRARAALELVAIYAHQALQRALIESARKEIAHTPLSPREREVMQWVAIGKTDDEIAEILSISEATVKTHFRRAGAKMNAVRRAYAVVQAIRLGEIVI